MHDAQRGLVVHGFCCHRANQSNVVRNTACMRQKLGELHAALAARMKFVGGTQHLARLFIEVNFQGASRIGFSIPTS